MMGGIDMTNENIGTVDGMEEEMTTTTIRLQKWIVVKFQTDADLKGKMSQVVRELLAEYFKESDREGINKRRNQLEREVEHRKRELDILTRRETALLKAERERKTLEEEEDKIAETFVLWFFKKTHYQTKRIESSFSKQIFDDGRRKKKLTNIEFSKWVEGVKRPSRCDKNQYDREMRDFLNKYRHDYLHRYCQRCVQDHDDRCRDDHEFMLENEFHYVHTLKFTTWKKENSISHETEEQEVNN